MHQGEKLKNQLKKQKITQEELAEKLGISRNYLIILTKEYKIKPEYKDRIIDALGLQKDFFDNENVNTNSYNANNELSNESEHFDLKLYRMNKRLSQKDFAEALGITQGYLSELESFKKEISDAIKYRIIELYGDDISNVKIVQEAARKYQNNKVGVPFYEVDVSASAIEMFKDKHEIPSSKFIIPGFEDCDFAVPVFGHSMYPTYENGSIIMCKKIEDKQLIVFGEAYMIVTKDFRMVKRLQKSDITGHVLACSDNEEQRVKTDKKKYEPIDVPIDKILHLYLVKGVIKRNQL